MFTTSVLHRPVIYATVAVTDDLRHKSDYFQSLKKDTFLDE